MRTALRLVLVAALLGASGWYYAAQSRPAVLVLTGVVTTNDVVVAPQIGGRIAALHVKEGDAVTAGQVLAEIEPGELAADRDYYTHSAESLESAVREQQASLRLQRRQLQEQETQAEASIGTRGRLSGRRRGRRRARQADVRADPRSCRRRAGAGPAAR
jgi:multidrug resistance efflux pump